MKKRLLIIFGLSVLFTLLFYRQMIGLNLFIFDIILFIAFSCDNRIRIKTATGWVIITGISLTAIMTLLHASTFVVTMNLINLFIACGWLLFPGGRSLISFVALSFGNIFAAPSNLLSKALSTGNDRNRTFHILKHASYFIIPAFLVLFFLLIYQQSNPFFGNGMRFITDHIVRWINLFFEKVSFSLIGVFLLGVLVSVFFIFRKSSGQVESWDRNSPEQINRQIRKKGVKYFRSTGLKTEYRVAIVLLISLNLLIAVQNILDIRWIWFGFEWNGQYLKQFVHEGTYLLILSILVSIVIMLWFFRGNLNFYPGNRLVKNLSYAWLAQNMLLTISVCFRVYWYIHFFALAYLRIGVILFLIITFIGLITVLLKVIRKYSFFYLLRTNTLLGYMVLIIASCINWDAVIANYNFNHYRTSFVHLDWLCTLSDKALPALDRSPGFLATVKQCQDTRFTFEMKYMEPATYRRIIESRKKEFLNEFDQRSFLSWNLADEIAAHKLRSKANFKKIQNPRSED